MNYKDLYSGFIRLHILYHASKHPVYGLWLIEELSRHGYIISPGTMYPILHGMEKKDYLASEKVLYKGKYRRVYKLTEKGQNALEAAYGKVKELFKELIEEK
jgi:DNA-binding PadR family transcriptional regulator